MTTYDDLLKCYNSIKHRIPFKPKIAVVLGSGLGDFANKFDVEGEIPYSEIDDFPVSTAPGHVGRFVFVHIEGIPVAIMQGRVHYYEGYPIDKVVLPIRLLCMMGTEYLLLTNAAGGINRQFRVGDFMMITDHISCFSPSPLIGENIQQFGDRFPDMTDIYKPELQNAILRAANKLGLIIQKGVYLQTTGPAFETPAEIRMFERFGADAVGMSTTCEATTANHAGMKVCGISCISNAASGITGEKLSGEDVNRAAEKVRDYFARLITSSIIEIAKE